MLRDRCFQWIGIVLLALPASGVASTESDRCWQEPHLATPEKRFACLDRALPTSQELARLLALSNATTDHHLIAGLFERIRRQQVVDPEMAELLARFLPHQHPIYQDRDRWHVIRLRAYLIATLTDIGFPDSGLPWLADSLIFIDERMAAVEVGSAVRAAGTLGEEGRQFLPTMLRMLSMKFSEEEFSLSRYDMHFPKQEATTVQLEVLQAVTRIGRASDGDLLITLRAIAHSPSHSPLDPRVQLAAQQALRQFEQRTSELAHQNPSRRAASPVSMATPWWSPTARPSVDMLDTRITDHDGRHRVLRELIDRPVILVFFYTRCHNAGKCSTSVSRLAYIQRELQRAGLDRSVRLLAITFEPAYDTTERLKPFVQDRGLTLTEHALTIRIHEGDHQAFMRALDIPVSYNAGWVTTHGVEAVLLDAEGRLARKYAADGWTYERIAQDLERLDVTP